MTTCRFTQSQSDPGAVLRCTRRLRDPATIPSLTKQTAKADKWTRS
uniref:Uncharacterized protein n=1 Tax=Rhizophora mucronata TaxID=61149 RepID=A0A2P2PNC2_RHIMU